MSTENAENISTTDSLASLAEVKKRPILYEDTANQKEASDRKKAWEEAAECLGKPVTTVRGHYENRRSSLLRRIKSKAQQVSRESVASLSKQNMSIEVQKTTCSCTGMISSFMEFNIRWESEKHQQQRCCHVPEKTSGCAVEKKWRSSQENLLPITGKTLEMWVFLVMPMPELYSFIEQYTFLWRS